MKLVSYLLTLIIPGLRSNVAQAVLVMVILLTKAVLVIYIPVLVCLIHWIIKSHLQRRQAPDSGRAFCQH